MMFPFAHCPFCNKEIREEKIKSRFNFKKECQKCTISIHNPKGKELGAILETTKYSIADLNDYHIFRFASDNNIFNLKHLFRQDKITINRVFPKTHPILYESNTTYEDYFDYETILENFPSSSLPFDDMPGLEEKVKFLVALS